MTALRMALSELRRLESGRRTRLALAAALVVPVALGGLALYAQHDPYGRLDQVPAALVVQDQGSTDLAGKPVQAGQVVADQLVADHAFDWRRVSASEAAAGVRSGSYQLALTIPAGFSAALGSVQVDPQAAQLRLSTGGSGSALSRTVSDVVTGEVRTALAKKLGNQAASQFLLGLSTVRDSLDQASTDADQLVDRVNAAQSGSAQIGVDARQLSTTTDTLGTALDTLVGATKPLPGQAHTLATDAAGLGAVGKVGGQLSALANAVASQWAARRAQLVQTTYDNGLSDSQRAAVLATYDALGGDIAGANTQQQAGSQQLAKLGKTATKVATESQQLATVTDKVAAGATQTQTAAGDLAKTSTTVATSGDRVNAILSRLQLRAASVAQTLRGTLARTPSSDSSSEARIASTIGNPVATDDSVSATTDSGPAPLLLALAAWLGVLLLLLLVRPLSDRALVAGRRPWVVALGGWLAPVLGALAQGVALFLVLELTPARPSVAHVPGTLLVLALVSVSFAALVHGLAAWFGRAGVVVGLLLLVVQVLLTGGTFPWQTLPTPLHGLHYLLPLPYAVDGLRQVMYAGPSVRLGIDVLVLVIWLAVGLAASVAAASRHRVWTVARLRAHPAT